MIQLSDLYMTTRKTIALSIWTFKCILWKKNKQTKIYSLNELSYVQRKNNYTKNDAIFFKLFVTHFFDVLVFFL